MKCLSVMQPWASLILHGHKQYETRTWATGHRGWLALHACRSESREAVWLTQSPLSLDLPRPFYRFGADLPRGVLLGVVELEDCVPTSALLNLTTRERVFGDFRPAASPGASPGRGCWTSRYPSRGVRGSSRSRTCRSCSPCCRHG